MVLNRLMAVLLVVAWFGNVSSSFAQSNPEPKTSLYGTGRDDIDWSEAVTRDSIRYVIGLRAIPLADLPIVVQNISDEPIENLRLRIVWSDGDDRVIDEAAWVFPRVLQPGQFGIAGGNPDVPGASFPDDHGTIRVYPLSKSDPVMEDRQPLAVVDGVISDTGRFEATLHNQSDDDVQDVWVHWICVEQSGFVTEFGVDIINDVQVLRSGAKEEFIVSMGDDCAGAYLIDAEGMVRP